MLSFAWSSVRIAVFEQFSQHAAAWRQAIGCLCLIDGLVSLAVYSSSVDGVFPQLEEKEGAAGLLDIEEGRHPCLDLAGDALIPNDTRLSQEKSLIVLTGTGTSCACTDPTFLFNADPKLDPAPREANLQPLVNRPSRRHFEIPRLHCESPWPFVALFWASKASEFWHECRFGSSFHSNADPDPASQNDADLDQQTWLKKVPNATKPYHICSRPYHFCPWLSHFSKVFRNFGVLSAMSYSKLLTHLDHLKYSKITKTVKKRNRDKIYLWIQKTYWKSRGTFYLRCLLLPKIFSFFKYISALCN